MKTFWDKRYEENALAYGLEPNEYFKAKLPKKVGKILLPGDGQGRNALYAALNGWEVVAFDYSPVAKQQAEALFAAHHVSVDYQTLSYETAQFEPNSFDCIALIYSHMPSSIRPAIHRKYISLLQPNGVLILEGFSKKQLGMKSGGPQDLDFLFDAATIAQDFSALSTVELVEQQTVLQEGEFHHGPAEIIRYLGHKIGE
jgi:SAM-dependent methyltransferase